MDNDANFEFTQGPLAGQDYWATPVGVAGILVRHRAGCSIAILGCGPVCSTSSAAIHRIWGIVDGCACEVHGASNRIAVDLTVAVTYGDKASTGIAGAHSDFWVTKAKPMGPTKGTVVEQRKVPS